jgi:hypothetical protein
MRPRKTHSQGHGKDHPFKTFLPTQSTRHQFVTKTPSNWGILVNDEKWKSKAGKGV